MERLKTATNLSIASAPTENQTQNLPNTSLEGYRYTNLLGFFVLQIDSNPDCPEYGAVEMITERL
jgi:hypothetical protein